MFQSQELFFYQISLIASSKLFFYGRVDALARPSVRLKMFLDVFFLAA